MCGLQYFGSTVDRFCLRWNNYRCSTRVAWEGGIPKHNYFHQHFLKQDHPGLLDDCKIRLIDKTDCSNPIRREFFWMYELKILRYWDWIFVTLFSGTYFDFLFQSSCLGVYLRFSTFAFVDLMPSGNGNCNFDTSS